MWQTVGTLALSPAPTSRRYAAEYGKPWELWHSRLHPPLAGRLLNSARGTASDRSERISLPGNAPGGLSVRSGGKGRDSAFHSQAFFLEPSRGPPWWRPWWRLTHCSQKALPVKKGRRPPRRPPFAHKPQMARG